jgi:hypothetical protein
VSDWIEKFAAEYLGLSSVLVGCLGVVFICSSSTGLCVMFVQLLLSDIHWGEFGAFACLSGLISLVLLATALPMSALAVYHKQRWSAAGLAFSLLALVTMGLGVCMLVAWILFLAYLLLLGFAYRF